MSISKANGRGYILVDVLVAITILAIGIVFVVGALSTPMQAVGKSINEDTANRIIQQSLDELRRNLIDIPKTVAAVIDGREFILRIAGQGYSGGLCSVLISVAWEENGRTVEVCRKAVVYLQQN